MSMWNVEQMAKMARLTRIVAKQARRDKDGFKARAFDGKARRAEASLRDYATDTELTK